MHIKIMKHFIQSKYIETIDNTERGNKKQENETLKNIQQT